MDSISLVMFVVPLLIAIIFTMLSLTSLNKPDLLGLLSSVLAAIAWFIFGLTWPVLATTEMLSSVGLLWYAVGTIFSIIAVYIGMRMMLQIFEVKKQPRLAIQNNDSGDED